MNAFTPSAPCHQRPARLAVYRSRDIHSQPSPTGTSLTTALCVITCHTALVAPWPGCARSAWLAAYLAPGSSSALTSTHQERLDDERHDPVTSELTLMKRAAKPLTPRGSYCLELVLSAQKTMHFYPVHLKTCATDEIRRLLPLLTKTTKYFSENGVRFLQQGLHNVAFTCSQLSSSPAPYCTFYFLPQQVRCRWFRLLSACHCWVVYSPDVSIGPISELQRN